MRSDFGKMNVSERSPERLRLTYLQWYPGVLIGIVGAALLYAGVDRLVSGAVLEGAAVLLMAALPAFAICAVTTRRVTLILDATVGIVHVHNGPLTRRRVRSAPLAMLQGAEEETDPQSPYAMKRVLLMFEDRPPWPVTRRSFAGDGPRRAATVINTWLASHGPRPEDTP